MANDETGKDTTDAGTDDGAQAKSDESKSKGKADAAAQGDDKQGDEGKPKDSGDKGSKADASAKQSKAPTTYDLAVPKGAETYVEGDDVEQIKTVAKAKGWSQEQAQEALDEHADAIAERSIAFREQLDSDPVYGGKHIEQTQIQASRALEQMWPKGSDENKALGKLLTKTGFGNHRLIVGGLANIGKKMQEDAPADGKSSGGAKKSPEEVMYPD